ncbi:MAG: DNRLRE domain-containing protein, partial [Terriglobales bacterium]
MIQRKKNRYTHPALAVLLGGIFTLALAVPSTAREEVILQKSASDPQTRAAENFLDQANRNTVNAGELQVQSSRNANQRALILFDFSLLPNVGIKSAELTLTIQTHPSSTRTYDAFPIDSFFVQPAATWNTRVADLGWKAVGGDIPGTATSSANVTNRMAQAN